MGDENQLIFVRKYSKELRGPFLEVGSRDYGNTQDLRSIFNDKGKYIGLDLSEGKGVDIILDLTQEFEKIDKALNEERFNTIICLSVLEHCEQPFVMADNLTRLLRKGGHIIISVPFAYVFHGYPSDYWRFTHEGVKKLFPKINFDIRLGNSSTPRAKEISCLDNKIGMIEFNSKSNWSKGYIIRGLSAKTLKLLSKIGIFRWFAGYGYVLAPTMINMIGRKSSGKIFCE